MYKQKYFKYKQKYLELRNNMKGGADTVVSIEDVLKTKKEIKMLNETKLYLKSLKETENIKQIDIQIRRLRNKLRNELIYLSEDDRNSIAIQESTAMSSGKAPPSGEAIQSQERRRAEEALTQERRRAEEAIQSHERRRAEEALAQERRRAEETELQRVLRESQQSHNENIRRRAVAREVETRREEALSRAQERRRAEEAQTHAQETRREEALSRAHAQERRRAEEARSRTQTTQEAEAKAVQTRAREVKKEAELQLDRINEEKKNVNTEEKIIILNNKTSIIHNIIKSYDDIEMIGKLKYKRFPNIPLNKLPDGDNTDKFIKKDVCGDGDCFYHALLGYIRGYDYPEERDLVRPYHVRKKLLDWVNENVDGQLRDLWTKTSPAVFDIETIRTNLTTVYRGSFAHDVNNDRDGATSPGWATDVTISIVAKVFNMCIFIWDEISKIWRHFSPELGWLQMYNIIHHPHADINIHDDCPRVVFIQHSGYTYNDDKSGKIVGVRNHYEKLIYIN
tara:strand:- start:1390 stop:2919 length:1530 start_codon:yes stop_codon:yes gene_type:complete